VPSGLPTRCPVMPRGSSWCATFTLPNGSNPPSAAAPAPVVRSGKLVPGMGWLPEKPEVIGLTAFPSDRAATAWREKGAIVPYLCASDTGAQPIGDPTSPQLPAPVFAYRRPSETSLPTTDNASRILQSEPGVQGWAISGRGQRNPRTATRLGCNSSRCRHLQMIGGGGNRIQLPPVF
jgi:hypothetical protein